MLQYFGQKGEGEDDGVQFKFGRAPIGCSLGRDGENNCPTCWENAVNMKADNKLGSKSVTEADFYFNTTRQLTAMVIFWEKMDEQYDF